VDEVISSCHLEIAERAMIMEGCMASDLVFVCRRNHFRARPHSPKLTGIESLNRHRLAESSGFHMLRAFDMN
jgi:stress-induced morphogen